MRIIDLLVTHSSSHPGVSIRPLLSKCCESGNIIELLILRLFAHLDSQL